MRFAWFGVSLDWHDGTVRGKLGDYQMYKIFLRRLHYLEFTQHAQPRADAFFCIMA